LRHEALFKEAPQRDRQFARNRDNHDPSDSRALPCSSLHKPAGDCTFWLVLEPEPSRLNHGPAHLASPGSGDSLGSLYVAAVVRTRCKAEKAGHLPPIVELAIVDLACHDGGNGRSDPGQTHQLKSLLLGGLAGRRRLVALAFERCNLLTCGPTALQFEIVYFTLSADYQQYANTQQTVLIGILERFRELGVQFATPVLAPTPTRAAVGSAPARSS